MRVYTSAIVFDNAGNIASIERGMCCDKLTTIHLIACREHWLTHRHDSRFTGMYEISCDYSHSIQAQIVGVYANNQQYFAFVGIQ